MTDVTTVEVKRTVKAVLGATYRDKVSGFTGIATVRATYVDRTVQVELTAPSDKNAKPLTEWFSEARLEHVGGVEEA